MVEDTESLGMRLIILNQFFYPDHSATSQLMTDLAESLVERGVEVTALAGRGRYNGGGKLPPTESYNDVHIVRAWATSFGKRSVVGRLCDYFSFYLGAGWRLIRLRRHDIVLVLTTPPLIGLLALIIGRLRDMRVVALVQDLYPDVAVAIGTLTKKSITTRLFDWLNRFALLKSDRIIVLGECMRERVVTKLGEHTYSKIDVIHNWADGAKIKPLVDEENSFSISHGLSDHFVVLFSGNLGHVNEFSTVLEAARILRNRFDIVFMFVGDGAKATEIKDFSEQHNLSNVRLLPYQPRELLRYSLSSGDVSLVTLAEGLAGLSVPSKTYGILAAGKPLLFVGDPTSDTARVVVSAGCGAVISSGESQRLADLILDWASDKKRIAEMGLAARSAFERSFDRPQAVRAYLMCFARALKLSPEALSIMPHADSRLNDSLRI